MQKKKRKKKVTHDVDKMKKNFWSHTWLRRNEFTTPPTPPSPKKKKKSSEANPPN